MSETDPAPQHISLAHSADRQGRSLAHLGEPEGGPIDASGGPGHARRPVSPHVLLRFKGTIIGVFLALAVPAALAVWLGLRPVYRAEALLEVRSKVPIFVKPSEDTTTHNYQQYLRTQVDIITSDTVLNRVLGRADVRATGWYREPDSVLSSVRSTPDDVLDRLREAVVAAPRPGTELISIAAQTRIPQDAAVVANALLDEYLEFAEERLSAEERKIKEELEEERKRLGVSINFSEEVIADARKALRTGSPDELIAQRRVRLDQLDAEVAQFADEIEFRRRQLDDLETESTSQPAGGDSGPTAPRYTEDAEWRRLHAEWRAAQQRAEEAALQFQPAHPIRMRLDKVVEGARALLDERQEQLDRLAALGLPQPTSLPSSGALAASPDTLRREIHSLEMQKELREDRAQLWRDSFDPEFNSAEALRKHTEELQRFQARLQDVRDRLSELDDKERLPATIRTIGRALAPSRPFSDKRLKLSVAALVAALAAGLACAYLRTAFSPQVQEVGDVNRSVRGAFLGYLPFQPGLKRPAVAESALHGECVRMIRTALLNRIRADGSETVPTGQVVQLASAGPGAGKSTLAVLLARSLALSGKRVLLVDADLHQPSLAQHFSIEAVPGLGDLLAPSLSGAPATDGEAGATHYRATSIPTLSILPCGRVERDEDLELLVNGTFSALLSQWRSRYDFILLDGPPLLQTADATILSRHADGTILVVRERHCRRMALVEALAVLSGGGGKLLGTVFVGSEPERAYGYGYGYASAYGSAGRSSTAGDRPAHDQPLLEDQ